MSEYIIRETGSPGAVKQEYLEELIRCKDCKWYKKLDGLRDVCDLTFCTYVYGAEFVRKEWEYCSRGERKDDATND